MQLAKIKLLTLQKNFKFKNNITFNKITKNPVKALLLVDVYGLVPDYEFFRNFCSEYNLKLIVDSSESLGSNYKMKTSASFSDLSAMFLMETRLLQLVQEVQQFQAMKI